MADGGRHLNGNNGSYEDWDDLDWLEETPPPARQPRPAQSQRPAQQRPVQGQPVRERRYMEVQPEDARPPRKQPRPSRSVEVVEPAEYRPKRRHRSSLPLILLIVVLVGGIAFAGFKLGGSLLKYHRDRSAYDSLSDQALSGLAEPNATHSPDEEEPVEEEQAPSQAPFAVNWDYLKSVNSDVVGWLYCEGTRINYPVAQTGDNDYYLHRDFTTQQQNFVGTLFVDYNAVLGVHLSNLIIYGHHMQDGSMFASLEEYASQEYYQQHPVMYFLTPEQNYRIDLIAARIVEAQEENYPIYFQDESAYANYQYNITATSFFRTSANVTTDYQLISLSTCDYTGGYQNPRFLVQGLLVPIA